MEIWYILFGMIVIWMYTTVKTHQTEHKKCAFYCMLLKSDRRYNSRFLKLSAVCTLQNIEFFNTHSVIFISFMPLPFYVSPNKPTPGIRHSLCECFQPNCVGPNSHIMVTKSLLWGTLETQTPSFWNLFTPNTSPRFALTITSKLNTLPVLHLTLLGLQTSCLQGVLFEPHSIFLFEPTCNN